MSLAPISETLVAVFEQVPMSQKYLRLCTSIYIYIRKGLKATYGGKFFSLLGRCADQALRAPSHPPFGPSIASKPNVFSFPVAEQGR